MIKKYIINFYQLNDIHRARINYLIKITKFYKSRKYIIFYK